MPRDIAQHQLSVAMVWHHRGYPVIPLHRTKKRPLVAGFGREATPEELLPFSSAAQIEAWWRGRFRRAHVGILTGRGAGGGLLVVDLDAREPGSEIDNPRFADFQHGIDVFKTLIADASADWPQTYEVATPGNGRHLHFLQPAGEPLGCTTRGIAPLIDTRGHGGLIVAPGSFSTAQGTPYSRISPPELMPQELPAWLLALLRPPVPDKPSPARQRTAVPEAGPRADRYAAAALQAHIDRIATAGKGGRWKAVTAAAFALGELHDTAPDVLNETDVTRALVDAATTAGMNQREAERAIRTAWAKATRGTGAGA